MTNHYEMTEYKQLKTSMDFKLSIILNLCKTIGNRKTIQNLNEVKEELVNRHNVDRTSDNYDAFFTSPINISRCFIGNCNNRAFITEYTNYLTGMLTGMLSELRYEELLSKWIEH